MKLILLILIIAGLYILGVSNRFKTLQNSIEESFSTMDVYLKKRYDLIPNLVETVKGYAKHEADTLETIVAMRGQATTQERKFKSEEEISGAIRTIFAVAESYPDLKADSQFLNLQENLTKSEEDIAMARKYYNRTIKRYNDAIVKMPRALIAERMGLSKMPMWEANENERENVKVEF